MTRSAIALFALGNTRAFAERIADALSEPLARHEERSFEDGEHKARPLESVRGRDVYVVQQFHADAPQSVDDRFIRLLFFVGALRDAEAARITVVMPYLPYSRKDRRTKARDPVTTRYVAQLLESLGVDRVVAMDVHNPAAVENALRVPFVHLEARALFAGDMLKDAAADTLAIVSPDAGGYKRAEYLRELIASRSGVTPPIAFLEKKRSEGTLSGDAIVGDVQGRTAVIVDDLVSTGSTLMRAARTCAAAGASTVRAFATHGLFAAGADDILTGNELQDLTIVNTVPADELSPALRKRVRMLDCSEVFAGAIQRLHEDASISDWIDGV
ncbi:MAG TPA: ribose-phosphate diphosphokinase [Gammaproteobacteria bacterium]|nr:ribose-phosphate diphosphokinase [Gammaproteobacteria bacterium]